MQANRKDLTSIKGLLERQGRSCAVPGPRGILPDDLEDLMSPELQLRPRRADAPTTHTLDGGAGGSTREGLRGRTYAEQVQMLAPAGGPVQRREEEETEGPSEEAVFGAVETVRKIAGKRKINKRAVAKLTAALEILDGVDGIADWFEEEEASEIAGLIDGIIDSFMSGGHGADSERKWPGTDREFSAFGRLAGRVSEKLGG